MHTPFATIACHPKHLLASVMQPSTLVGALRCSCGLIDMIHKTFLPPFESGQTRMLPRLATCAVTKQLIACSSAVQHDLCSKLNFLTFRLPLSDARTRVVGQKSSKKRR